MHRFYVKAVGFMRCWIVHRYDFFENGGCWFWSFIVRDPLLERW
ncbi:hypothetical protein [Bartonella tribocorum]|nr:hypothetical protein [Bartonella tribocorum]